VVGVILTIFSVVSDRKARIERYLEEIDDFKKATSEEARFRLAGNIRRLARHGKTDIDFSGLVLRDFSFTSHDIHSLEGATFSSGLRLDKWSENATELEEVDFSVVNCHRVVFSRNTAAFPGLGLVGKNLYFYGANLRDACFDGPSLTWTNYVEDEGAWYEDCGEDSDGRPISHQKYHPAVNGANLDRCSFRYAAFRYRGYRAKNRYIVFQVLPHTLGLGPEVWRVLAKCHDMRNVSEYEGALDVNERIVQDLLDACDAVRAKIETLPVMP
jgi:uncharacterized protein YjbI with pentapeptide repeats